MKDYPSYPKIESVTWKGFLCLGATHLLHAKKTVLLNSSQGKQPTGDLPWVEATLRAVTSHEGEGGVLLTSTGLSAWELVCWAAGNQRIPQIVAVPGFKGSSPDQLFSDLLRDFELDSQLTCAILIPADKRKPKSWWTGRDELIISSADSIAPVSVRKGGRLDELLTVRSDLSHIENRYRIDWFPSSGTKRRFEFDLERIRSEVDPLYRGWLTHWTRAADGPWPGETRARYYSEVATSRGEYPRSARRTLERINNEGRIRASSWRIRGQTPVVSFTGLAPSQAVALMRWRSRYARYTIEPYGVAIRGDVARATGFQPVVYQAGRVGRGVTPLWSIQSPGVKGDWPGEEEYRRPGDLDLNLLPAESWRSIDLTGYLLE